jgi:aldehyde dehydrogenase (NAD+)
MSVAEILELPSYIAGEAVGGELLDVIYPYTGEVAGRVRQVDGAGLERALTATQPVEMTRWQRHEILTNARGLLSGRAEEFAQLIRSETGLCIRETRYEVGRTQDVLQFAAMEALRDDGQIFSCDISPQGQAQKIFTIREPLKLVAAITPFNHPLNQVAHKLSPAIAAGAPVILKPSEKTPLTALRFTKLLY